MSAAPPLLELPLDRARPAIQSYAVDGVGFAIPADLTVRLRALSLRHGVKLFTTLLGAFGVLLHRLSGQDDIVIGTPVPGRLRDEQESVTGIYVNTLPLRLRFDDDPSVTELLARTDCALQEALAHQDVPFASLVGSLDRASTLSHSPIFQVMFVLDQAPVERPLSLPALQVRHSEPPQSSAQLDLTLSLRDTGQGVSGSLVYACDLFDRASIENFGACLLRLLEDLVVDDQQAVSSLNLMPPALRQKMLLDWNATAVDFPIATLPELFARQVARTPNAVAVVEGERTLSYLELDHASDHLAAALQERGVQLQSVVGVALHRSLETVVAAWAVLKAGGIYLPLDPTYPAGRLTFMLEDAGACLVLTDEGIGANLPPHVPQCRIDQAAAAGVPSPTSLVAEQLAYIIYTSGSTGNPKGVAVSHRSAANLAFARAHEHDPIGAGDRVLAAISTGFDVSIGQLLLPLLSGASVVIAPDLRMLSAEEFWELIATQRVTHINSVPSFFDSVLESAVHAPALFIKRLMLGGEPLSGALCRRLRKVLPDIELFNMYGPTEACIDATVFRVPADIDERIAVLPIGRPLANYRAYVLDEQRSPVPPGVPGELYLGGAGLAQGYVGRPELTAERFIEDPFSGLGERLYRTGDRALWRHDGSLLYLGRVDEQLKIRGFRVEPGEIEAALRTHPQIEQAAVLSRPDARGTIGLVAYVVPNDTAAVPALSTLRQYLAQRLPAHMIPNAFVFLESLPLTHNGKLDRRALPAPDEGLAAGAEFEPPVGEIETKIAQIWQSVLGLPRIGRRDNFFELGGHSLLVLKVLAALKAEFRRPIVMAWVFQAPTPARLAVLIAQQRTDAVWEHLVVLKEGGHQPALFCLNGFNGDVHDYMHIARLIDPSVPVYGLQVGDAAAGSALHESLQVRMAAYEREIRSVQPEGPYRLCGFSFGGTEAFELARRLEDAGEQVFLILLDAYRPSKSLTVQSWIPRMIYMFAANRVLTTFRRKIRNLLTYEMHHWLTGRDKDLRHALLRGSARRKYRPLSGNILLITSNMSDYWAYRPRLDGHNGWKKLSRGRFDVIHMQCEHLALIREPLVQTVAAQLNSHLCG